MSLPSVVNSVPGFLAAAQQLSSAQQTRSTTNNSCLKRFCWFDPSAPVIYASAAFLGAVAIYEFINANNTYGIIATVAAGVFIGVGERFRRLQAEANLTGAADDVEQAGDQLEEGLQHASQVVAQGNQVVIQMTEDLQTARLNFEQEKEARAKEVQELKGLLKEFQDLFQNIQVADQSHLAQLGQLKTLRGEQTSRLDSTVSKSVEIVSRTLPSIHTNFGHTLDVLSPLVKRIDNNEDDMKEQNKTMENLMGSFGEKINGLAALIAKREELERSLTLLIVEEKAAGEEAQQKVEAANREFTALQIRQNELTPVLLNLVEQIKKRKEELKSLQPIQNI